MRPAYTILSYQTSAGKRPFDEWLEILRRRNSVVGGVIDSRVARIRDHGNFGDCRSMGHGVFELRIHLGPGYRVYYTLHGEKMVIMLGGGEKDDQVGDIQKAYEYAADFRRRV